MNIFVTGGTGFLGYNTILRLLRDGHHVIALVRQDNNVLSNIVSPQLQLVKGSLDGEIQYSQAIDACIHFAWGGVNRNGVNDGEVQKQNVSNTLNLVEFLLNHHGKLLIDAGSRQEYAPTREPITEENMCNPVSEYGKWKLEAFQKVSDIVQGKMKYAHLRIFSTYGIGDHPWSLINSSVEKMLRNDPVELGMCRHFWSFLYIDDFADLVSSIINKSAKFEGTEIYNVGSGYIQPLRYFVNTIKSVIGSESELQFGKFVENKESVFPLIPDISKVCTEFGWFEKTTFANGITTIFKNKTI